MSAWGRTRRPEQRRRWPVPERIRPTKVGFWYILCSLVVGVAATNTGNNALYIVLAVMLSLLIFSGVVSRFNLKGLAFAVVEEHEVFAKRPFHLEVGVKNRSRWTPKWLLVLSLAEEGQPLLIPYLPGAGTGRGFMEMLIPRRGRHRFSWLHVGSIFPVGFFHKGLRYAIDVEVLVYPEIFPASAQAPVQSGNRGEGLARKSGWGHDLHSLRSFQPGDDPRRIHWKQTARTGKMIFTQREAEEGNRLSILFDNAVGELRDPATSSRFESLISEAATTALDYLDQGFEVELVTRDTWLPFGGGRPQRTAILQTLALMEAVALQAEPLVGHGTTLQLWLGLDRREEVA